MIFTFPSSSYSSLSSKILWKEVRECHNIHDLKFRVSVYDSGYDEYYYYRGTKHGLIKALLKAMSERSELVSRYGKVELDIVEDEDGGCVDTIVEFGRE